MPDIAFPQTRYQGSKLKLSDWIRDAVENLEFDTVLDAFGGSGSVSFLFKKMGKRVTYNDLLTFNYYIGLALIENAHVILTDNDVDFLLEKHAHIAYPSFIQDTFHDTYFTDEENDWLDYVVTNIEQFSDDGEDKYKKAIAFFALFQSAIIKRPFNLFHRKNLYIRTADVERSFGNKTTWEKPFDACFRDFVAEANQSIFCNHRRNSALNQDAFEIVDDYDLVYIDTPYISAKGVGVDYLEFYHFLEGLTDYKNWGGKINYKTKHRKLQHEKSIWANKKLIHNAFDQLFAQFQDSILVVSYRDGGIPTSSEIVALLKKYKGKVDFVNATNYQYVLSNDKTKELLFIAS
ncbi:MAG: DNA adenine methylase [Anaerolineae bacterium]|nr:DNA adenine methylase [Anaerolineae bacterium]